VVRAGAARDRLTAVALCLTLSAGWAISNWAKLSQLWLPDADDMLRLAQVLDWLGGQGFHDLTAHQIGPAAGLAMHWSRVADLMPAAIIALLSPPFGAHHAELAAVLMVPAFAFFLLLLATLRLFRAVSPEGDAFAPLVIAALAFPATGMFQPGRIDHHGLQLVLLVFGASALIGTATRRNGIYLGVAIALSLAIGVEMIPFLAVMLGALGLHWACDAEQERVRLITTGGTMVGAALIQSLLFIPLIVPKGSCDSFALPIASALAAGGALLVALGMGQGLLPKNWHRILAMGVAGGALLALLLTRFPECRADPYSLIDPLVARLWLSNVGEAQGLLTLSFGRFAIGHAGLLSVALTMSLWFLHRERRAGWAILAALLGASLALSLFQVRGSYGGAALAATPLAVLVNQMRAKGTFKLLGAWALSCGILYDQVPARLMADIRPTPHLPLINGNCASPELMQALTVLPPATFLAPMEFATPGALFTRHHFIAAPYHRNNVGNRLQLDALLAPPTRTIAADYVLVCKGSLGLPPASLAAKLEAGLPPNGFLPVKLPGDDAKLYRVLHSPIAPARQINREAL
jgi:hypothetical protein